MRLIINDNEMEPIQLGDYDINSVRLPFFPDSVRVRLQHRAVAKSYGFQADHLPGLLSRFIRFQSTCINLHFFRTGFFLEY